ncbi:MAG: ferritin-like domain-containing protein [Vicinamibacterales bacterium]
MPRIDSLQTLLIAELRDLLDAEKRLTKALPKMAKAANSDELRQAFTDHLEQTEEHVTRLEEALTALDADVKGKTCHAMMGLLEEGTEQMQEDYDDDSLRDAAIIGAAQKVEHYEIASYGTAATFARLLGNEHVASLLESTLEEEKQADQKLTQIAESTVNPDAADDADSEQEASAGRERSGQTRRAGRSSAGSGAGTRTSKASAARSRR